MDMFQAARYFDLQDFENFDTATATWTGQTFQGQQKVSDKFSSIYHRPTRKAMLYCAEDVTPASVIRNVSSGEVFMVGTLQPDTHDNTFYRKVYAIHRALALGTLLRKAPVGPVNNPGWAVEVNMGQVWVDLELRSANENEELIPISNEHYFVTMPSDADTREFDSIVVGGVNYWAVADYVDSSFKMFRAGKHKDPRDNLVFRRKAGTTYSGGQVVPNWQDFNITARTGRADFSQSDGITAKNRIKIMIQDGWIGVTPTTDDKITVWGKDYDILTVTRDSSDLEWNLLAGY